MTCSACGNEEENNLFLWRCSNCGAVNLKEDTHNPFIFIHIEDLTLFNSAHSKRICTQST